MEIVRKSTGGILPRKKVKYERKDKMGSKIAGVYTQVTLTCCKGKIIIFMSKMKYMVGRRGGLSKQ